MSMLGRRNKECRVTRSRAGPHGDDARPWVVVGRLGSITLTVPFLLAIS
jgi:hypothetical protein